MPRRLLVIGYGNPGRLDDGLGPAFAAQVERLQLPDVSAWKGSGNAGIQLQTVNGSVDDFRAATLP